MKLRGYCPEDCRELAELFYHTVHRTNSRDYTAEQCSAWASGTVDLERWNASFLQHLTLVAQLDGKLAGFADMDAAGFLDRLYVRWDCQRRGVATALCDALGEAVAAPQFTTHASITAKGFFEKRGYCAIRCQQVQRGSQCLTNFVMVKVGR